MYPPEKFGENFSGGYIYQHTISSLIYIIYYYRAGASHAH